MLGSRNAGTDAAVLRSKCARLHALEQEMLAADAGDRLDLDLDLDLAQITRASAV